MTAPITGPFTKVDEFKDIPAWNTGQLVYRQLYKKRVGYRQAKPYNLPLQLDAAVRWGNSRRTSSGPYGTYFGSWTDAIFRTGDVPTLQANVYNKAYSRFVHHWKETVEMGVATSEGRQAVSMISQRLLALASFTRHLARGNIGLAAGALGFEFSGGGLRSKSYFIQQKRLPPTIKALMKNHSSSSVRRETIRQFSQIYLEFYFGWKPLVGDIYDAIKVMDSPFNTFSVKSSAKGSIPDPFNVNTQGQDATYVTSEYLFGEYKQTVRLQADLVITNPNLAMMESFGIANPLSIAWELVPFSFVVDWFVNVGDYLGSLTDFAGVQIVNGQMTIHTHYTGSYRKTQTAKNPATTNSVVETWVADAVTVNRRLGLGTGPSIRLRAAKQWELQRGFAAASLLMQRFPKSIIDSNRLAIASKRTAFRQNTFPQFFGKYF